MARNPQLNVRLTTQQRDAIEAAVFLQGLRSPQPLLEPLLEQLTAHLLRDPAVRDAVALRQGQRGEDDVVRQLPRERASRRGGT